MGGGQEGGGSSPQTCRGEDVFFCRKLCAGRQRDAGCCPCGARVLMCTYSTCGPGCPLRPAAGALGASLVSAGRKHRKDTRPQAAVQTAPWDRLCLPSSAVCSLQDLHAWRLQTDPHWAPDDLCHRLMLLMKTMPVQNQRQSRHSSLFFFFFFFFFQRGTLWA